MKTRFMTRIVLFVLTNLAVLAVLAVVLRLLGVDRILDEQGVRGPAALPDSLKAFGIRGATRTGLARLFMSHPPLEERIAALQKLAG